MLDLSIFESCRVLVIGDIMLDEYVWGDVERISPEAPVQIVGVTREDDTLGGAGNVVNNLVSLGAGVSVCGVVGTGVYGNRLIKKFADMGVETDGIIRHPDRPTTRKTRVIASNQHVIRIDRETRQKITGNVPEAIIDFIKHVISDIDVILISDYNKGLLTESLLSQVIGMAKNRKKPILADPKGIDFSKYAGVTLLTPNQKEAALASGIEIDDTASLFASADKIMNVVQTDRLLITRGRHGMVLFHKGIAPFTIEAEARQVFDVSGAGDTVLAVLGVAVAAGLAYEDAAILANKAAGIVVGKVGTAPITVDELAASLKKYPDTLSMKHKTLSELSVLTRELKRKGKRIVLTNGCFDLLHVGHIMLFSKSRQFGDVLIVAIDDDASVKRLKGQNRPVIDQQQRIRMLSALDSVDYVTVFSSDELESVLDILQPDILTKGSNYSAEQVVGAERIERCGGKVVLIPVTEDVSSTHIINTIRQDSGHDHKGDAE